MIAASLADNMTDRGLLIMAFLHVDIFSVRRAKRLAGKSVSENVPFCVKWDVKP